MGRQPRQVPGDGGAGASAPTRFVGRERELELLTEAFARAASGQGQVVFVAGEAGIGKSRLLAEFRAADRRPAAPLDRGTLRLLRHHDALPPGDRRPAPLPRHRRPRRRGERHGARSSAELERLGADLAWTLPFVKQVLALAAATTRVRALDSASRRSEIFRALRALTLRAAEVEPLVIVIEDLHWIDPASEEYLAFVADVGADDARPAPAVPPHRLSASFRRPQLPPARVAAGRSSDDEMAAMTGSILGARRPAGRRLRR